MIIIFLRDRFFVVVSMFACEENQTYSINAQREENENEDDALLV